MVKLKPTIASLDAVPEAVRGFYVAKDGIGFILDLEDDAKGFGLDNIAALRGKLAERDTTITRLNERLQAYKKDDGSLSTPEEIASERGKAKSLEEQIATLKSKNLSDEQKLQQLVAEAKRPLEAKLTAAESKAERLSKVARSAAIAKQVDAAVAKLNPLKEWEPAVRRELTAALDAKENAETGDYTVYVRNAETGTPRMSSRMAQDGPMSVGEYAEGEFATTYKQYLSGDNRPGAGVGSNPGDARGGRTSDTPAPRAAGTPPGRVQGRDLFLSAEDSRNPKVVDQAKAWLAANSPGGEVVYATPPGQPAPQPS